MRLLLRLAWRNLGRQARRTLITASAMAVAVAMCMAMIAFNDGTYAILFRVMVEQQLGHVQVHHPDYPGAMQPHDTVPDAARTVAQLRALPEVVAVSGKLNGAGLIGGADQALGGQLVGIDPAAEAAVTRADERVVAGRFLSDEPAGEILLGAVLARDLGVALGDSVVVVTQAADGSLGNELYEVVGLFRTGSSALDRSGTMLHVADLQALLALPDQLHELTVIGHDPDAIDALAVAVRGAVPEGIQALTWREADPMTAQMMDTQIAGSLFMLGLVFTVASFGVLNTMLMSVFERTRELGLLKAIGLRPGKVIVLVVLESALLACLSGAIGLVLGGALDLYIVTYGITFADSSGEGISFNGVTLDPTLYGLVRPEGIVMVLVSLLVVSVLASLYPAWRAARLVPVDAMRVID